MPMRPEFTEVRLDEASQSRGLGWVLGPDLIGMCYYLEVPYPLANCQPRIEFARAD
jgi:hypothetical protein